jgi:anti-sigma regulatory factor (Ser/Thr protein kinase)
MPATISNGCGQEAPSAGSQTVFHLPPRAQAAQMGRVRVRRALSGAPKRAIERIELMVSELVTNSVTHAALSPEQSVDLRISIQPRLVRIEVADSGAHFDLQQPRRGGESKWGLFLLNGMADRWGMQQLERGKVVWFEVDL